MEGKPKDGNPEKKNSNLDTGSINSRAKQIWYDGVMERRVFI